MKKNFAIVLIVLSVVLFSANLYTGFTSNKFNYFGIASNLLLMAAMVMTLRDRSKKAEN